MSAAATESPWTLPEGAQLGVRRAAGTLREAVLAEDHPSRYARAHVAALQAAAAVLAARARPTAPRRRRSRNAWVLLAQLAPEMGEWAQLFASGAAKRAAAEAGSRRAVTPREADDLVRDADRFLAVVERSLGLMPHAPVRVV